MSLTRSEIINTEIENADACVCNCASAIVVGPPSLKNFNGDLRTRLFKSAQINWAIDVPDWVQGRHAEIAELRGPDLRILIGAVQRLHSKHSVTLQASQLL